MTNSRDLDASRFAAESLERGDPTGWFEELYTAAAAGSAIVPWDVAEPNALLTEWTERKSPDGAGKRALVVGCGLGRDAEHIAALGFQTTAFDISDTAIATTRDRYPTSTVDYVVADLLNPPPDWTGRFDFVVESITVQSLPLSVRPDAITHIARMVAPGGTLLVISAIRTEEEPGEGPPWPLTRSELDAFAVDGLRATEIEKVAPATQPDSPRWRATFERTTE